MNKSDNNLLNGQQAIRALLLWGACTCLGCGGDGPVNSFAHLELLPPDKELVEFSLGDYMIPIPTDMAERRHVQARNRVQLQFSLMAELDPDNEGTVTEAFNTSESQIRDSVIRVCRQATMSDLEEPNLVTLKTDLLDAVEPFLGPNRIQRLVVPEVQKYEL